MKIGEQPFQCDYPAREFDEHPKIRLRSLQNTPQDLQGTSRLVTGDALIEFRLAHKRRQSQNGSENALSRIYASWIIGLVVGVLGQVDLIRSKMAWDAVEFGLEVEIFSEAPTLLQWTNDWESAATVVQPAIGGANSIALPRYSVGPRPEFNELIRAVLVDLSNAAGTVWDFPCDVPWHELLK
jgi:hypothetical protein